MKGYGNEHKAFLQHMLRVGCKHYDNAFNVYLKLGGTENHFPKFIREINEKIDKNNFNLMQVRCEVTQQTHLTLINTLEDEIIMLQHQFTSPELEYFHLVMHEVIHSDEKRLKQNFCLNLSAQLPSKAHFTAAQAERMIEKCCKTGYLLVVDIHVYLGPRGICEFMPYIQTKYSGLWKSCNLCSEIVIFGSTCSNCDVMFHNYCLKTYLRTKKRCPNCRTDFPAEESMDTDGN